MEKDRDNIVKYRRFHVNIGMIIFLFIIIYVLFSIFSYFTSETVSEYEVTQGTIASNHIYKAVAVRSEEVITAPYSGTLLYYHYDTSKTGVNDVICSIDSNGNITKNIINSISSSNDDNSDFEILSSDINNLVKLNDFNYFQVLSSTKNELSTKISQSANQSAMGKIDSTLISDNSDIFHIIKPSKPGIVSYSFDGMEQLTVENYSIETFANVTNYKKENLSTNSKVSNGSPIYRIVDNENWNLIVEVPSSIAEELSNKSVQKIKFCKDNFEMYANFYVDCKENLYYIVFSLNKGMIRYINDRYLDIELVINENTGLKIPNSSIVEKNFYTIPLDCLMKGGDSNDEGIMVQRVDKDGKIYDEFINPTIYFKNETYCYIDNELVTNNDKIYYKESTKTYNIGDDVDSLIGVYNINKGYAVFKQIKILSQNKDYSIIEPKMAYGIALYDHIALEGDKIKENQTIKK